MNEPAQSRAEREKKTFKKMMSDLDRYAHYSGNIIGANQMKVCFMLELGKKKEADEFIKETVKGNIGNLALYGIRAHYILENEGWAAIRILDTQKRGKDYDEGVNAVNKAIEDYSIMIALDPSGIAGRYERAEAYANYKEDYDKAIADMNVLIDNDSGKSWKYIFNRGFYYKKLGRMEEAVRDWQTVLEKKPDNLNALSELQVYYNKLKDGPNTARYLDKYLSLKEKERDPNYTLLAGNLTYDSKMFSEIGDCENAEKYYRKACQYNKMNALLYRKNNWKRYSTFETSNVSDMVTKISACFATASNHKKSIDILNEAIGIVNEYIDEQRSVVEPSGSKKDDDWSLRYAYDTLGGLHFDLGGIYFDIEKFTEAIEVYGNSIEARKKCISETPLVRHLVRKAYPFADMSSSYFNRGLCYARLGDSYNEKLNVKKACELGLERACKLISSR